MRRWLRGVRSFLRLPAPDQWLFLQATAWLGLSRLAIDAIPFARLTRHLGPEGRESASGLPARHLAEVRRIAWAVRTASRYTPWKSNCFPSAIAAKRLLERRGIASTLYLGAAFKARSELEAHAWLRAGSFYVTGGPERHRFGTVAVFGSRVMSSPDARSSIGPAERRALLPHEPAVLWFTGLPASGKTTIAEGVESELNRTYGALTYLLDGDRLRTGLNRDLGFSEEARRENIRRAGEVAALMCDAGLIVLAAFISPYAADRQAARAVVPAGRFIEVFVECPLEVCESRDPKGLYARARQGLLPQFTGIDAPYEPPGAAEITLRTDRESASACVHRVVSHLERAGILGPARPAIPRNRSDRLSRSLGE